MEIDESTRLFLFYAHGRVKKSVQTIKNKVFSCVYVIFFVPLQSQIVKHIL